MCMKLVALSAVTLTSIWLVQFSVRFAAKKEKLTAVRKSDKWRNTQKSQEDEWNSEYNMRVWIDIYLYSYMYMYEIYNLRWKILIHQPNFAEDVYAYTQKCHSHFVSQNKWLCIAITYIHRFVYSIMWICMWLLYYIIYIRYDILKHWKKKRKNWMKFSLLTILMKLIQYYDYDDYYYHFYYTYIFIRTYIYINIWEFANDACIIHSSE